MNHFLSVVFWLFEEIIKPCTVRVVGAQQQMLVTSSRGGSSEYGLIRSDPGILEAPGGLRPQGSWPVCSVGDPALKMDGTVSQLNNVKSNSLTFF